jgi:hypothetical protein
MYRMKKIHIIVYQQQSKFWVNIYPSILNITFYFMVFHIELYFRHSPKAGLLLEGHRLSTQIHLYLSVVFLRLTAS